MKYTLLLIIFSCLMSLPGKAHSANQEFTALAQEILARCRGNAIDGYKMDSFTITDNKLEVTEIFQEPYGDIITTYQSSVKLDALTTEVVFTMERNLYLKCKDDISCFDITKTLEEEFSLDSTTSQYTTKYRGYGLCEVRHGEKLAKQVSQIIRHAN